MNKNMMRLRDAITSAVERANAHNRDAKWETLPEDLPAFLAEAEQVSRDFPDAHRERVMELIERARCQHERREDLLLKTTYKKIEASKTEGHRGSAIAKGLKFPPGKKKGSQSAATKHIFRLVRDNPSDSAKELRMKADISIIGAMRDGTFAGHVTEARKLYPKVKRTSK